MSEALMEIPEGFKETEIEPLPEDWKVARLGQIICDDRTTLDPRAYPNEVFEHYSIPAYQESGKPVLERGCSVRSQKLLIQPETVLFGKLNPRVHKVWYVSTGSPRRKIASTEFIPLVAIEGKVSSRFLYFLAWSDYLLLKAQKLVSGSTPSRQRVDRRAFLRLPIPLPPLPEQRKIVKVLSTIQRAIEQQDEMIAAACVLKSSLMRHLFTYGSVPVAKAEGVPLKETEGGAMPGHWEVISLGAISDVKGGKRLPKGHRFSSQPTSYPYLRVVDFKDGSIEKSSLKYLTPEDYELIRRYTISVRDVYMSIAGTIGLVGTIPPELNGANLTENAAKVVIENPDQLDRDFLVCFLASPEGQEQIDLRTTKTTQPKLALGRIKQIPIPLPPLLEQQRIAAILRAVDRKIAVEKRGKELLQQLFRTMLHRLMTGHIVLKDIEV